MNLNRLEETRNEINKLSNEVNIDLHICDFTDIKEAKINIEKLLQTKSGVNYSKVYLLNNAGSLVCNIYVSYNKEYLSLYN